METAKGREIKFRAFIDGEMVMLPLAGLQYFDFEGSYALSFVVDGYKGFWAHEQYDTSTKKIQDSPIMQFTGLLDKNGVEIYEGDVVKVDFSKDYKDGYDSIQVIEFYEGSFGSRRLDNDHFRIPALFSGRAVEGMNLNYFEVIGNLYTNPELLNQ